MLVEPIQPATHLGSLRELVVPERHLGALSNVFIWHRLPRERPPVPHLAVVLLEDVLDVVAVGGQSDKVLLIQVTLEGALAGVAVNVPQFD